MADPTPGTAPVVDRRTSPRGVLPKHAQTWLMVGLALVILAIIVFAGQPAPERPAAVTPTAAAQPSSPTRLRDYEAHLRVLDERARANARQDGAPTIADSSTAARATAAPSTPPNPDPLQAERRRKDYESLFASNIVLTRRSDRSGLVPASSATPTDTSGAVPASPSLEEVADAVVRATTKYGVGAPPPSASAPAAPTLTSQPATTPSPEPTSTGPISSTGRLHRLLEGTVIDAVLTNRLDGSVAAPVNCLVTSPVYSHDGQQVLIPAGSRILGQTRPVESFGETRLAVALDRLVLPDGSTHRLEHFVGLDAIGEAGLHDQVDQHYRSTFGAAGAVGLITGLAQYLGASGLNTGSGNRTLVIAGSAGDATAQATAQTLNRFLNRVPTVTIREGHRVKVYLTSDLDLPAYAARDETSTETLAVTRGSNWP